MANRDAALIDVTILEDPRLLPLPRSTRLMQIEAYVWCRQHRTDGVIPRHMLARFAFDADDREAAAASLVDAGLWRSISAGWRIVNFLTTQMSRRRVEHKRQVDRDRWDRWQEGPPPKRVSKRVSKRVGNASDLTRPDLTRMGKGGGGHRVVTPTPMPVRTDAERIADARHILDDPAAYEPAKRAARKELEGFGIASNLEGPDQRAGTRVSRK